ncbi:12409_t:CDS:2, partial [Rhizophagus irregularis]
MAPSAPTTSTNTTFNTQFGFGWIEVSSTDIPSISVKGSTLFTRLPPKQRVTQFKQRYPHFQAIHESQRRDHYNDIADAYANEDHLLPPNPKVIPDVFMTPLWDDIDPIDRDIRNTE